MNRYELMMLRQQHQIENLVMFLIIIGILITVFCFFLNYSLVRSRGRKEEMCLWMTFTFFLGPIITLILLIMIPVDRKEVDYEKIDFPNGRFRK